MRIVIIGGTRFIGRRVVERLAERGDSVLAVHRRPAEDVPAEHLLTDRHDLGRHAGAIRAFGADVVIDSCAMTGADVDAVLPALPDVPAVVLSSQDVYEAHAALVERRVGGSAKPIDEDDELRRDRYPYRGRGLTDVPDDYSKRDVEDRWLARRAVVLRLPMVYGPRDPQRREEPVLRRVRAGRDRIPTGSGDLLWTRGHVDDVAEAVLAAVDSRRADGLAVNIGEQVVVPIDGWLQQILAASGSTAELTRVPDDALPPDLALTATTSTHLVASVARARELLGWTASDPARRVAESVRWHLEHPPTAPGWDVHDGEVDDAALDAALDDQERVGTTRELVIRPAVRGEAAVLSDLALRSKAHWGYDQAFLEAVRAELTWTESDIASGVVLVAESQGAVVGFAVLGGSPPDGELDALFVDRHVIGTGAGGALLRSALAEARSLGFRRLYLDADPGAESFYLHHRARRVGETASGSIGGRVLPRLAFDL